MDFLLWIIVLGLFVLSFVALVYPVLPSVTAVWGGFLVYHFFINSNVLTTFFWVSMVVLTIFLLGIDILAGSLSVKYFGGSKLGERVAAISVLIGSFIYPPLGIIVLPFVAVFFAEMKQDRSVAEAIKASIGSLVGFLSGRFAEGLIQLAMILWFFFTVWF